MNDEDPEVTELLADLTRELRRLQREVEPDRRLRGPSPRGLARFTSEVAIPALILMLQTQIRALELLRRTIRLAEGRDPRGDRGGGEMRQRAETLGRTTLTHLDEVLSEVQSAVEGRPENDRAQHLLSEARDLREQIQDELDASDSAAAVEDGSTHRGDAAEADEDQTVDPVDIDVEAELRSLKDQSDDDDSDGDPGGNSNGGSTGDSTDDSADGSDRGTGRTGR